MVNLRTGDAHRLNRPQLGRFSLVCDLLAGGLLLLFVFVGYGILPNKWYHSLYVYSGSMAPVIEAGDVIIITPPPVKIIPGMIVTLRVDEFLVTHRVITVRPDGSFITRGDANIDADEWGNATVTVVGQYRARIPYLGYVFEAMRGLAKMAASGAWFVDRESLTLKASCCDQSGVAVQPFTPTPLSTSTQLPAVVPSSTPKPTLAPTFEPTASETAFATATSPPTSTPEEPSPTWAPTESPTPEIPTETSEPIPTETPAQ